MKEVVDERRQSRESGSGLFYGGLFSQSCNRRRSLVKLGSLPLRRVIPGCRLTKPREVISFMLVAKSTPIELSLFLPVSKPRAGVREALLFNQGI